MMRKFRFALKTCIAKVEKELGEWSVNLVGVYLYIAAVFVCFIMLFFRVYYFAPKRGAKYYNEYVCLSVRSHSSKAAHPNLPFFAHVAYGYGSVLL